MARETATSRNTFVFMSDLLSRGMKSRAAAAWGPKLLEVISKVANEPTALLFASNERGRLRDVAEQIGIHRRYSLVDTPPDLLHCVTRHVQRLRHLLISLVQDCPSEHTLFGRRKMEARHLRRGTGTTAPSRKPAFRILTDPALRGMAAARRPAAENPQRPRKTVRSRPSEETRPPSGTPAAADRKPLAGCAGCDSPRVSDGIPPGRR